jgi:outer membrane murein-binding lipoprotein Lpp
VAAEAEAHSLRLRRRRLESQITQLRFQLQAAQDEAGEAGDIRRLAHDVQRLGSQKDAIDRAMSAQRSGFLSGGGSARASEGDATEPEGPSPDLREQPVR